MGRPKKAISSDTFINIKEPDLTKDTLIKNEKDIQSVLRKYFYKCFNVYQTTNSNIYVVIFHVKWYEWRFKCKIRKVLKDIIYKIPSNVFVEFTICVAPKK